MNVAVWCAYCAVNGLNEALIGRKYQFSSNIFWQFSIPKWDIYYVFMKLLLSIALLASGYVNRIRRWPFRRDDHTGVVIGAGGERRSYWPAHALANDVSTRINR